MLENYGYGTTWGQGQLLREFQENPQSREQLRNRIQNVAQGFFNQNPNTAVQVPPPALSYPSARMKPDYTPFYIAAAATIIAALIIAKK